MQSTKKLARFTAVSGTVVLLVSHCSGSGANSDSHRGDGGGPVGDDARAGDDGGLAEAGPCEGTAGQNGPRGVPAEHRPVALECSRNSTNPEAPDAALVSCNADPDCQGDTGSLELHCAEHVCGYDACLVDADCPTGNLCVCKADAGGSWGDVGNACVPAQCHVDADCGAGEYCTPSRGYCGAVSGFYCTSSADTCVDPTTDCTCGGNSCVYAPTVGHFLCATSTCNG
jgi:hypothetical protein